MIGWHLSLPLFLDDENQIPADPEPGTPWAGDGSEAIGTYTPSEVDVSENVVGLVNSDTFDDTRSYAIITHCFSQGEIADQ